MDAAWAHEIDGEEAAPLTVSVRGRRIVIPQAAEEAGRASFRRALREAAGAGATTSRSPGGSASSSSTTCRGWAGPGTTRPSGFVDADRCALRGADEALFLGRRAARGDLCRGRGRVRVRPHRLAPGRDAGRPVAAMVERRRTPHERRGLHARRSRHSPAAPAAGPDRAGWSSRSGWCRWRFALLGIVAPPTFQFVPEHFLLFFSAATSRTSTSTAPGRRCRSSPAASSPSSAWSSRWPSWRSASRRSSSARASSTMSSRIASTQVLVGLSLATFLFSAITLSFGITGGEVRLATSAFIALAPGGGDAGDGGDLLAQDDAHHARGGHGREPRRRFHRGDPCAGRPRSPSEMMVDDPEAEGELERRLAGAPVVRASRTGYLGAVDYPGLLGWATENDLLVEILLRENAFVLEGEPVARVAGDERRRSRTSPSQLTELPQPHRSPGHRRDGRVRGELAVRGGAARAVARHQRPGDGALLRQPAVPGAGRCWRRCPRSRARWPAATACRACCAPGTASPSSSSTPSRRSSRRRATARRCATWPDWPTRWAASPSAPKEQRGGARLQGADRGRRAAARTLPEGCAAGQTAQRLSRRGGARPRRDARRPQYEAGGSLAGKDSSEASSTRSQRRRSSRVESGPAGRT